MAEEITLKVNVETGKAVTNLGNLEKATKQVSKSSQQAAKGATTLEGRFDQLNKEIKESPVNIRQMNKQIQEYQAIALQAGRTSPLGKKAIQEAAQMKDKYNDINAEVNRLANDGVRMQAALNLGTSVIAGYTAFQGAMALAGVDSEEFRETLMKLQGAQALLMGVETIRKNLEKESTLVLQAKTASESASIVVTKIKTFVTNGATAATKFLRLALISLPFIAIGIAIVAIIKNFDKLKYALGGVTKRQAMLNETMDAYKDGAKAAIQEASEMEATFELAKKGVISKEEALNTYNTTLGDTFGKAKDLNEAEDLFIKKTKVYIESQAMRAQASVLFEAAAKEELELIDIVETDQRTFVEKSVGWFNNGLAAIADYSTAGWTNFSETSKEFNKGVDESRRAQNEANIKASVKTKNDLAKELLLKASMLDKENEIISDGQVDIDNKAAELRKQRRELEKKAIYDLLLAQKQADAEEIIDAEAKTKALIEIEKFKLEQQLKNKKLTDTQIKLLEFQTEEAIDKIKEKYAKIDSDRQQALNKKINDEHNALLLSVENLENAHFNRMTEDKKINAEIEINAIYDKYNAQIEALKSRNESTKILEEAQGAEIEKINKKYKKQELIDAQEIKNAKIQASVDSIGAIINLTSAFAKDNEKSQRRAFEINKKLQIAQALIQTYQGVQAIFATSAANPLSIPFPAYPYIQAAIALTTGLANIQNIRKQQFSGGSAGGSFGGGGGAGAGGGAAPQIAPVTNTSTLVPQDAQQVYVTETDITNTQNKVSVIEAQSTF